MTAEEVSIKARALYEQLGPKSIATAAQRAVEAESAGKAGEAATWRRIEETCKEMRGSRES
jgi:hypothetical protein